VSASETSLLTRSAPGDCRCWEQHCLNHFGYWPSRVMTADILIATWVLQELMARLPTEPEVEDIQLIEDAANTISELRGQQWREMVRQPFWFPITVFKEASLKYLYKKPNDGIKLEDLGL
jgi:hypothetical protein